jgi:type IV pilus assembly protein PilW
MNNVHRYEQRGFSLIEVMVGLVIGLISVLVIYQVFAAAEGIKRNTTSIGDAQQNGLLSSFILNIEVANASNGIADAMVQLGTCNPAPDPASNLRPIPLLISDGGGATNPDTFVVNYSVAQRRTTPATVVLQDATSYTVTDAPIGFANGDLVVAISPSGSCAASSVTVAPAVCPVPSDQSGCVQVTPSLAPLAATAYLLNMGPTSSAVTQRMQYDVSGAPNGTLESTVLWDQNGQPVVLPGNPIASNVVNMKLLYGIDNGAGGVTWTPATGAWSWQNVLAANTTTLGQIKAVRMGIVVRGEQWDKSLGDQTWTLFADTPAVMLTGTIATASGNYRMRTYETIIPLRNSLWNPTS